MQTRDHKLLGKYLLWQTQQKLPLLHKMAFIAGNVEPDRNYFTYLHGMLSGKKFHGHNYENMLPVMHKLYHSLQEGRYLGIRKYYQLGKLIHYTADAFTYPHNEVYKEGLIEHRRYERQLHDRFLTMLQEEMKKNWVIRSFREFEELETVHKEYLQNAGGYIWDCKYILMASVMMAKDGLGEAVEYISVEKMAG